MAAFSTTADSMKRKITLLQAACRGYLVRKKMDQVKALYTGIVEDLEGKKSAEELQWLVHHRFAVPVHEQKQSEIELIIKRWSEKEASHLPKADEEKKNSYSSDSFESESSSGRSSSRVKTNISGDETGSTRSKVSLTREGAVLPEDSENDGDGQSVGVYSGSHSSNNSTNSNRDKMESDHVGDGQSFDCSESGNIPLTDRTAEKIIEQKNVISENTAHGSQDVLAPFQEVNDSSDQTLPQGNPSLPEAQKSDGFSSMNDERSAVTADNVLQGNLGDENQRGKNRKDEEMFVMSTQGMEEEKWTDQRGEKKENVLKESDKDIVRSRTGELQKDKGLTFERISSSDDKLSEKQAQIDNLCRTDFSTRETTSSRNDDVKSSSNGRKKMKEDPTSANTADSYLEEESLARNLEKDFQSVEPQDEERTQRGNETGREVGRGRNVKTGMKEDVDEVSDNDGISFIPPSPILPQGVPKKDHLVSSPVSPPPSPSPSPSDIPEKLTGDMKGVKNGQSEFDAESTVLTKVTNMTSLSMWNDDTSVWNSEEDSPSDPSSLPESLTDLQDLRKNIAMELLWVQQAIQSRKAYLRLKENLGSQTGD